MVNKYIEIHSHDTDVSNKTIYHLSTYISFCLVYLSAVRYLQRKSKMNNINVDDCISFWENESWMLSSIFINVHCFLGIKILWLNCPEIPDNVALLLCHWIRWFCMNLNALFWLHLGITESKCSGLIFKGKIRPWERKMWQESRLSDWGFSLHMPLFSCSANTVSSEQ